MAKKAERATTELCAGLRRIGVAPGDCLVVHCAFKPLKVAGFTPDELIDALREVLGSEGTLMMPTFTYSYSGIWNVIPFNPDTTPGVENGVLSETFRCRAGVLRSGHPTYSVAAIGKQSRFLTAGRERCSPLGHGSSFEDALGLGARILLLGVGNNRNPMIHYIEVASGLPYNDIPFRQFWGNTAVIERNGSIETAPLFPEYPACSDNFLWLDKLLAQAGIANAIQICGAHGFLIDALRMKGFVLKQIQAKADCLLCGNLACEPCSLRRRKLKELNLI